MKTISKVVIYYTDGTYQEVGNNPYLPTSPYPYSPSPAIPYTPPSYPPTWVSPFTFTGPKYQTWGINEAQCKGDKNDVHI